MAPSLIHPFGTDDLGRDVLARLLFGARSSLTLGISVVVFASVLGTTVGAIAGFSGGWVDELLMRFSDVILSFPPLLLAIALAETFEPSLGGAILAISITWWPWYARIARAQTVSLKERHFVLSARSIGATPSWILTRHVVPNVLGPIRVQIALDLGSAILTGAALSFLGLGAQAPAADWGVMVSGGRQYMLSGYWWMSVAPGAAIFMTVLAFNLFADGFHSALDPRARRLGQ